MIGDGRTVKEVAGQWSVSRQTLHAWLARYEAEGLAGLADRSRRPRSCPHQLPAEVEALALELRRSRPYWGARRLVRELGKRGVDPLPSESAVYRALLRLNLIDPAARRSAHFHPCPRRGPASDSVGARNRAGDGPASNFRAARAHRL